MRLLEAIATFVETHERYFAITQAASGVLSFLGWTVGFILLSVAWRRGEITGFAGWSFARREAIRETATAVRNWGNKTGHRRLDMARLRSTIARAFVPDVADNLTGKSILWVDDNPANNELAMRALRKLLLDVVQVTSTEAAMAALDTRTFDLVISDMGRGENMHAGYDLLAQMRGSGRMVPFFIFSSEDRPEYRAEAKRQGAQLATNDMLELIDCVVSALGKA